MHPVSKRLPGPSQGKTSSLPRSTSLLEGNEKRLKRTRLLWLVECIVSLAQWFDEKATYSVLAESQRGMENSHPQPLLRKQLDVTLSVLTVACSTKFKYIRISVGEIWRVAPNRGTLVCPTETGAAATSVAIGRLDI